MVLCLMMVTFNDLPAGDSAATAVEGVFVQVSNEKLVPMSPTFHFGQRVLGWMPGSCTAGHFHRVRKP